MIYLGGAFFCVISPRHCLGDRPLKTDSVCPYGKSCYLKLNIKGAFFNMNNFNDPWSNPQNDPWGNSSQNQNQNSGWGNDGGQNQQNDPWGNGSGQANNNPNNNWGGNPQPQNNWGANANNNAPIVSGQGDPNKARTALILAIPALIIGFIAIYLFLFPVIGLMFSIIAVVLGAVANTFARRNFRSRKPIGIPALIISIVALVLAASALALSFLFALIFAIEGVSLWDGWWYLF